MAKKKATKKKTMKKSSTKKTQIKKGEAEWFYLREIEVRYKKRRVSGESPINQPLTDANKVVELFRHLQNETKEKLIAISLDVKLRIITFEVVSIGSVAAISLRPFEILRTPVVVNAFGVILVHNHPSGDPKPSREDKQLTKTVAKLAESGGIAFHDHIIIGDDDYYSFRMAGLLDKKTK